MFLLSSEKVAPFGLYFFFTLPWILFYNNAIFLFSCSQEGKQILLSQIQTEFRRGKRGRALGINKVIIKREMPISFFLLWVCICLIAALYSYGNHQTSLFNSQCAMELVYGPCWTHTTSPRRPSLISSGQLIFVYIYTQGIPIPY